MLVKEDCPVCEQYVEYRCDGCGSAVGIEEIPFAEGDETTEIHFCPLCVEKKKAKPTN